MKILQRVIGMGMIAVAVIFTGFSPMSMGEVEIEGLMAVVLAIAGTAFLMADFDWD